MNGSEIDMPPMGVVVGHRKNDDGEGLVFMRFWCGSIDVPNDTQFLFDMEPDFALELAGLIKKEAKAARR